MDGAARRERCSEHLVSSRSRNTSSRRSGANTASAIPCAGSWSKSILAVPNGRSRSARIVSGENRLDLPKAQLWAMVDEPMPHLAPMKETDLQNGQANV